MGSSFGGFVFLGRPCFLVSGGFVRWCGQELAPCGGGVLGEWARFWFFAIFLKKADVNFF